MNKQFALSFLFFCLTSISVLKAQEKDFQSWGAFSAEWEFYKNWTISADQELRFVDNASSLGSYISVVGLQYKINNHLSVGGAYRLSVNNDAETETQLDHRFYADAALKFKPGRFTLAYRVRYQIVYQQPSQDLYSNYYPQHLRHKFSAKYNIRKTPLYPFAEVELYESLNYPAGNSIQKIRYTGGVGYPVTKYLTVEAYYRLYKRAYYLVKPKNDYVLGFNFNFSF